MSDRIHIQLVGAMTMLCSILLLTSTVPAYETIKVKDGGSITGVVSFDGDTETRTVTIELDTKVCGHEIEVPIIEVHKKGGLRNAVVFIEEIAAGVAIDKTARHRLQVKECTLEPIVQSMTAAEVLEISNADPIMHGFDVMLGDAVAFNANLPMQNMKIDKRPRTPGPLHFVSNSGHDWLDGWVYVVGHPYHAVTDGKGRFTIRQVPPGDYRLTAWHAAIGVQTVDVHVEGGEKTTVEFDALAAEPVPDEDVNTGSDDGD